MHDAAFGFGASPERIIDSMGSRFANFTPHYSGCRLERQRGYFPVLTESKVHQ
jgi:hypothetical protein